MRDALIAQLKLHEGWKRYAYMDTVGKVTVGCGRNLSDKGLSDEEIRFLLHNDIDECVTDLEMFGWFNRLDEVRQRVMLDFRFNLGPTRFRKFKGLIRALEAEDYEDAAKHLQQSLWFRQVKSRGVRLVAMMREGKDV